MSLGRTLILLGVLIALSPFVGLPYSYLAWVLPLLGLVVVATGVASFKKRPREALSPEHEAVSTP